MKIESVKYLHDYILQVTFVNGIVKVCDFEKFVCNSMQPMTNQFKDKNRFKKFSIDSGHLTWENGQMDISAESIYKGNYDVKK